MNINKVILTGRLVKDPELKKVNDNDLCNFRLASDRIVGKNKTEKNIFVDVEIWGGQGAACAKFLKKASRVAVDGVLCQDVWEGDGGKKNSKIYIMADNVMFMDLASQAEKADGEATAKKPVAAKASATSKAPAETGDEDIPF